MMFYDWANDYWWTACLALALAIAIWRAMTSRSKTRGRRNPTSSERLLTSALEQIEAEICVVDRTGQILESNHAWRRFLQSTQAIDSKSRLENFKQLVQTPGVYANESALELEVALQHIVAGGSRDFQREYTKQTGDETVVREVRLQPLRGGQRGQVLVTQYDRTKQRRSVQTLLDEKRQAETLASAMETSHAALELGMKCGEIGVWHWDIVSGYFEISSDWIENRGVDLPSAQSEIDIFRELVHPDEQVFWTLDDAESLAPDEPYDRQFRILCRDHEYRWVHVLGRATSLDHRGVPETISGILFDIDLRKSSALRDAGMAKIIEESFNEVYICDLESNRLIEVNRGARENLGYTIEELRAMYPSDLKPEMTPEGRLEFLQPILLGEVEKLEFECVHCRKDGTTYPILLSLQRGRLMDREVIVGIGVDLTQRRQLEEQLAEARKLESIGQLAAGIAHEMNTPLQYVGNNIQFLRDSAAVLLDVFEAYESAWKSAEVEQAELSKLDKVRDLIEQTHFEHLLGEIPKAIDDSKEGIDRVLRIIRAMKDFSHPGEQGKAYADLNRCISSTVTVTRNQWKEDAELVLDLDPNLPDTYCEASAIGQVLLNLIVNAADAIRECRAANPESSSGKITIRSRSFGSVARIEVEDNGCGMPEEVRKRIFDPFYTTKEVGKGTGQGLSLSHTIICTNHSGTIDALSTPDVGTQIRIELPVHPAKQLAEEKQTLLV